MIPTVFLQNIIVPLNFIGLLYFCTLKWNLVASTLVLLSSQKKLRAMAGGRTRVNSLEGSFANCYNTNACCTFQASFLIFVTNFASFIYHLKVYSIHLINKEETNLFIILPNYVRNNKELEHVKY